MVRGEGSYRWLCGCSHLRFPFCSAFTAALMMDDDDDAVRTYDCFNASLQMGDGGLTMVLCLTVDE